MARRTYRAGSVSHRRAVTIASEQTRDEMQINSLRELDDGERAVFDDYVDMIASGRRDLSWNGPLAKWLAMVGRRPLFVNHDVGSGDYSKRARVMDWRSA